jgi:hypothetical protein
MSRSYGTQRLSLNVPRRIEIRRYNIGHPYGIFEPVSTFYLNKALKINEILRGCLSEKLYDVVAQLFTYHLSLKAHLPNK